MRRLLANPWLQVAAWEALGLAVLCWRQEQVLLTVDEERA